MKIDMIMPQMGESIVEGTILKWRKRSGEHVHKDEMILDISTDKVDSEIPSPAAGVLTEILAAEGKTVAVGSVIARIESAGVETAPPVAPLPGTAPDRSEPAPAAAPSPDSRRFLSPVVKKIAREYGLNAAELDAIRGSGGNQRISKNDILAYLERKRDGIAVFPAKPAAAPPGVATAFPQPAPAAPSGAPSLSSPPAAPPPSVATPETPPPALPASSAERAEYEIVPMDHVRKRIAEHMVLSKHTSAHVTSVAEIDVTEIVQYRERVKKSFEEREGFPLTFTAFFVDVAARTLKDFPYLNSSVEGDKIFLKKSIHIGIAVGLENGLIVPVIRHADQMNLTGIARVISDLANRARTRQLKPDEVQGGTFTITNIGTFGNLFGTPVINQPQVAILGTGAIKKRPVIIDDAIAIRSMMYMSLTYDHRIIDGLYGGSFLQQIVQKLENYKIE